MFTPPPSPLPPKRAGSPEQHSKVDSQKEQLAKEQDKRRTARRFRTAAFLVPIALILFTAGATLASRCHLTGTSECSTKPLSWLGEWEGSSWRLHRRDPEPDPNPQPQASSPSSPAASASSSPTTTPIDQQPMPTVPTSTPAALPTPFLQPFDGTLTQNFTTTSCQNFFANMTTTIPFRSCRSFALLQSTSDAFIDAQTNLTLLNAVVWGTCNTLTTFDQCKLNMNWFAANLKTSCAQELKEQNMMAMQTLTGLQSYQVMHDTGCLVDPTTNTYCYVNAVRQSNPTDLYYYNIPLGTPLPQTQNTKLSCSPCSKSVMGLYASALQDPAQPDLAALKKAYNPSVNFAASQCGSDFTNGVVSAATSLRVGDALPMLLFTMLGLAFLLR
ncbi:hypothetical protein CVT24_009152 [Panaeolus cyanescens]|uniref:DUF7729 domain-containing protein n=1 Tax=Panaeolus cyanescens TaxID=181874 RepID=A0A409Y8R5_9AGAR|nr:hypothetical protein CVT24_009152 [Panaeolus cyanescens]